MIYYLGDHLDACSPAVAQKFIPRVVLCGNRNRAERWRAGTPTNARPFNFYAAHEGMTGLLVRHGYRITQKCSRATRLSSGE
jgi:hypothetical protein